MACDGAATRIWKQHPVAKHHDYAIYLLPGASLFETADAYDLHFNSLGGFSPILIPV
jgi:hypothetical protein